MHLIQDTMEGSIVTINVLILSDIVSGRTHLLLKMQLFDLKKKKKSHLKLSSLHDKLHAL